jgi:hypothetical protein
MRAPEPRSSAVIPVPHCPDVSVPGVGYCPLKSMVRIRAAMRLLLSSMHTRCQRLAAVGGHTFRSDRSSSGCLLQAGSHGRQWCVLHREGRWPNWHCRKPRRGTRLGVPELMLILGERGGHRGLMGNKKRGRPKAASLSFCRWRPLPAGTAPATIRAADAVPTRRAPAAPEPVASGLVDDRGVLRLRV